METIGIYPVMQGAAIKTVNPLVPVPLASCDAYSPNCNARIRFSGIPCNAFSRFFSWLRRLGSQFIRFIKGLFGKKSVETAKASTKGGTQATPRLRFSIAAAEKIAKEFGFAEVDFASNAKAANYVAESIDAVRGHAKQALPELKIKVGSAELFHLPAGTVGIRIAAYQPSTRTIALNPSVNWERLGEVMQRNFVDRYTSTPNRAHLFIHEFGHAQHHHVISAAGQGRITTAREFARRLQELKTYQASTEIAIPDELLPLIQQELGTYAGTNGAELVAEMYTKKVLMPAWDPDTILLTLYEVLQGPMDIFKTV